ncbi:MAG TPA: translation initiation factor IF-2 subunit gamma [Candidatus Diapherotrites archaeon]|uniref:protein-synthesizing GTPase n=1 Tax=Candidatus Iainarchaeum sp. TaxID=3101447 RepID=A0A7J4IUN3_9ARCH|nr:translation initiation factor IF-2 subunit gamma [Candidatus Diapherotrites archaeon]
MAKATGAKGKDAKAAKKETAVHEKAYHGHAKDDAPAGLAGKAHEQRARHHAAVDVHAGEKLHHDEASKALHEPAKAKQESPAQPQHKEPLLQAEVNIGTIGHVDHGKTSLVASLTGKWADTHSEEIKKGISIRLGYADATFYRCPNAGGPEGYTTKSRCADGSDAIALRRVSFVDSPGHETLMATMLSGAALMDGAILVIAANEKCPQPSTAEHLMALGIVGVRNVVVAQNKIDLVDSKRAKESYAEIRAFLKQYGYEDAPIIPIAANLNVNIDLLIEAIEQHIPTPKHDTSKEFRMFVVRSFDVNKPGTKPEDIRGGVLGGSITSGMLRVGDTIEIGPGIDGKPVETKVVSLGVEGGRITQARPGGLIAVGTTLDPFYTKNDEMRGQVVGKPGTLPAPATIVRLEVKPIERLIDKGSGELKVNDFVVLAVGSSTVVGQVARQAGKDEFEMRLKSPVVIGKGERVAVSKREHTGWRLRAYGICK